MKTVSASSPCEGLEGREPAPHQDGEPGSCPIGIPTAPAVPLRDVLDRVAAELVDLARLLERFETAAGPRILEAATRDPNLVRQLQSFDQIGQRVMGLVAFLTALAPTVARRCHLDPRPAAGVVTLADMAARLAFRDEGVPSASVDRGDCELL